MWRCTSCGEQNEDDASACWKCQQPGGADDVDPEQTHLDLLVDPEKPVPVADNGMVQCPTCGQQFRVKKEEASGFHRRTDQALCPHCGHAITPEVLLKVAPGKREGTSIGMVREVIYACPYCGKALSVQSQ